jgi:hypothetical protein
MRFIFLTFLVWHTISLKVQRVIVAPDHNYWHTHTNTRTHTHTHTHTHTYAHTLGRTTLDERSVNQSDLYLTAHNTHNRPINTLVGFEPPNPSKRATTDRRLRTRSHWDRQGIYTVNFSFLFHWKQWSTIKGKTVPVDTASPIKVHLAEKENWVM